MRNPDLIPERDIDFAIFEYNFMLRVAEHQTAWNIPAEKIEALQPFQARWTSAWAVARNKNSRTTAQVREKQDARKAYQAVMRLFIHRYIRGNPLLSDSDRLMVRIKPRKTTRTPVPVPVSVPSVYVGGSSGGAVMVSFKQQPGDDGSSRKAMPFGAAFMQIEISEIKFIEKPLRVMRRNITRSPSRIQFQLNGRGRQFFLCARWIGTRGQPGPWSPEFSFFIA